MRNGGYLEKIRLFSEWVGGVDGVVHEKPVALTIGNIGVFSGGPERCFREKKLRKFRDLWLADQERLASKILRFDFGPISESSTLLRSTNTYPAQKQNITISVRWYNPTTKYHTKTSFNDTASNTRSPHVSSVAWFADRTLPVTSAGKGPKRR